MTFKSISDALDKIKGDRYYYRQCAGQLEDTRPIAEGITDEQVDKVIESLEATLSLCVKERARALAAEHETAACCPVLSLHPKSLGDCEICTWTPSQWQEEARKQLEEEE